MNSTLHVIKVFVGPDGGGGNDLGVFLDGAGISTERRQEVAADLGFSETVFVEDLGRAAVRIHTPAVELPFAGHPLVGTSWLLARENTPPGVLRPPAGDVATWRKDDLTWIEARPEWAPVFDMHELASPEEVDAHPGAGPDEHLHVWAWENEAEGRVRVRVFPTRMGIKEDEATGAAACRLGERLGRPLRIRQGVGSLIVVEPGPDGTVRVGGAVEPVETRDYRL